MVVQLDVKKAFDHVDHRAAFKAMKLQGVSLFSMALIAAIWSGSCMKACLGTVTSNKVQMSRGLPQGAPESPVIFTMIMELVLRDLIKSWISRKLAWRLDDYTLAAICYADAVVLIAVSVAAAETMVSEVIEKTERGWTDGWRTENTLDEFPHRKDYDVAGFPLELECLDDGQDTERQNCELERENGGECRWSEKNLQEWSWDSGGDSGTGLVIVGSRNAV